MIEDPDTRARDRFAVLVGLRLGGAALMLVGLYLWLGGRIDGARDFATLLVVVGAVGALLVPRLLARRWRTPR